MVHLPIRQILERSVDKLKRDTVRILDNDLGVKAAPPYTLYSFTSRLPPVENAQFLARGSDIDIGGYSTNNVTSVPYPSSSSSASTSANLPPGDTSPSPDPSWSHVAFHGNMSLRVPQEQTGKIRAGYAGVRNRKRMTLFGEDCWDLSSHTHLKVEVAYRGWEGWRNRWYCNIQTDGPVRTDLYQHRLDIPPSSASTPSTAQLDPLSGPPPSFTTLHLPLSAFVLTNNGQTAERQIEMLYGKIRTIGFSLLGGGRGAEGVSSVNQASPAQIAEFRRRAQAGYGAGGGKEDPDPVVEDMLKADGYGSKQVGGGGTRAGDPARASGYHRVQTASTNLESEVLNPEEAERQAHTDRLSAKTDGTVKVTPWSEGYYELCVRSVQAVVFDPMADEEGPESRDM